MCNLHEDLRVCTFMTVSHSFLLEQEKFHRKILEKKNWHTHTHTHTIQSIMFMRKCVECCGRARQATDCSVIRRMRFAYRITKARIKTHNHNICYRFFTVTMVTRTQLNVINTYIVGLKPSWHTIFLSVFISFLYMFRATMCPSSEEITVFMRHLIFDTLCGWMSGMQGGMSLIPPCIPDSHPHSVTNTKCRIDTVISPDDGHMVGRNM